MIAVGALTDLSVEQDWQRGMPTPNNTLSHNPRPSVPSPAFLWESSCIAYWTGLASPRRSRTRACALYQVAYTS